MNEAALTLLLQLRDEATAQLKGVAGQLEGVSNIAATAVAGGFVAAAGAATAFAGTAVTAAADFESSVNNLASIAGTSLADAGFSFDEVSAKALELGQTTAFSASQSIAAMTELVKGGVPIVDVMGDATQATLDLASAGGLELATAAEIVSKQLGVWGDTGLTATQAADLLAQAANASTVGVEDLALGLSNVAGTAKTAGVDFEELTQTMALIAPGFASAADAGTSLKTFIANLQPTTGPAIDAFQELGLLAFNTTKAMEALRSEGIEPLGTDSQTLATQLAQLGASSGMTAKEISDFVHSFDTSVFYDMEGQFIGMEQAAQILQGAVGDLSESEKVMALNTMFGSDAIRAAAAIANAGSEGFNAMGESMVAAGTAAEVAAIQNQGFNFALDSLKGSIETLQIIIGTALLPVLTAFLNNVLIPLIGQISTFAQGIISAQDPVAALVAAFTAAGPAVGELGMVLGALVAGGIVLLAPAIAGAAAAFGGLVVAAAPVIAVLALAMAAGALLAGAWQSNFGNIQGVTASAMAAVQAVVSSVLGIVLAFWQQNGTQIVAFAQQAWAQLQQIIGGVALIIATVVRNVFGTLATFLSEHGASIQVVLQTAWNSIQNIITLALGVIQGIVTTVLGIITGDWETAQQGIEQIASSIATFVTSQFENLKGAIAALGPGFIAGAQSVGTSIVDGIVNGIQNGISAVTNAAKDLAKKALDAAKAALGISSPSLVFQQEVAGNITAGLVQGLQAGAAQVQAASASLAAVTTDAFRPDSIAPMIEQAVGQATAMPTAAQRPTAAPAATAPRPTNNTTVSIPVTINGDPNNETLRKFKETAKKVAEELLQQTGRNAQIRQRTT